MANESRLLVVVIFSINMRERVLLVSLSATDLVRRSGKWKTQKGNE